MGSFEASVKQFTIEAKENASLIFRTAADKLHKDVITPKGSQNRDAIGPAIDQGGNLPHDTGNLGRSLAVSTTDFPEVDAGLASYSDMSSTDSFTISGLDFGDTLYMGFQAVYAPRMNYGFVGTDSLGRQYNQSGHFFVELSAAKWQQFVSEAELQYGE
jgi:hypothetical protein